jgi:hypothetical protein
MDDGVSGVVGHGRPREENVQAPRGFYDVGIGDDVPVLGDDDTGPAAALDTDKALSGSGAPGHGSDRDSGDLNHRGRDTIDQVAHLAAHRDERRRRLGACGFGCCRDARRRVERRGGEDRDGPGGIHARRIAWPVVADSHGRE